MSLKGCIDLHCHTTASDGSLSPRELVRKAARLGLEAVAITDHDTIAGVDEGMHAGRDYGIEVVPGVEISTGIDTFTPHLLGYFIDPASAPLREALDRMKQYRDERNPRLIARLNELGIPITLEQVRRQAGGELIGRPHFARVLVNLGAAKTVQDAFDRYLGSAGSAYIQKKRMPADEAVRAILDGRGAPVLAHPFTLTRHGADLENILKPLLDAGLKGLEVYYPDHTEEETHTFQRLADRLGLVKTGGSDFHGSAKPEIKLGTGLGGDWCIKVNILPALRSLVV